MDRNYFYSIMHGDGSKDYEVYLNTRALLACQKNFSELCNEDELLFQLVHQVEELWAKLINYTLLEIDESLQAERTPLVLTLFTRVHRILRLMSETLPVLETMSPKKYQEIRLRLGNGSGQESPGFRTLMKMYQPLWRSFKSSYLDKRQLTLRQVYDIEYSHSDAYVVAEALAEYDELFHKFRYNHLRLLQRAIGPGTTSLKGRSVEILSEGLKMHFFPELWEVRSVMTQEWGSAYGQVRQSICPGADNAKA
jgi:tryptophan 2,3-dioxygenase